MIQTINAFMRSFSILFSVFLFSGLFLDLKAQLPEDFYDQKLYDNFTFPTGLTFDEEGRMYVWEKEGKVHIIDANGELLSDPLIDISEEVTNWKDHGLMGFVLDNGATRPRSLRFFEFHL